SRPGRLRARGRRLMFEGSASFAERTEEATPRRWDEAHEEGRIPRSQELTTAVSLLASAGVLAMMAPAAGQGLANILERQLSNVGTQTLDLGLATTLIRDIGYRAMGSI